jgi:hypothetical protein
MFVSAETLSNRNISVRHEDNNATMRKRFDHIVAYDATFKKLKDERKGKVITDVVWGEAFLGSKAKDALFSKSRTDLCATHFDANFLLEEIDKSEAEMNFTGVELIRRVDKRGEEKQTGKPITKKLYGSVLPSRGELSSVWLH